ncbi:hypothetical protein ANO11243_024910 [Dothideomycetidae sp. 11243]|nr:hypothetical protein ANO11243_024910 [fungal sp. No.11243]
MERDASNQSMESLRNVASSYTSYYKALLHNSEYSRASPSPPAAKRAHIAPTATTDGAASLAPSLASDDVLTALSADLSALFPTEDYRLRGECGETEGGSDVESEPDEEGERGRRRFRSQAPSPRCGRVLLGDSEEVGRQEDGMDFESEGAEREEADAASSEKDAKG